MSRSLADVTAAFDKRCDVALITERNARKPRFSSLAEALSAHLHELTDAQSNRVTQNMRLADKIAFSMWRRNRTWGFEPSEYQSVAYLGLVHAAQRFDPTRGLKFSTFAWPSIQGYLNVWLRDELKHEGFTERKGREKGPWLQRTMRRITESATTCSGDLDDRGFESLLPGVAPAFTDLKKIDVTQRLLRFCRTERECVAVRMTVEGATMRVIGKHLGVSRGWVWLLMRRIRLESRSLRQRR